MQKPLAIYWLRQDLRLTDNPALTAVANDYQVLPVYIYDDHNPQADLMGAASRLWLHHSLADINQSLDEKLGLYRGDPIAVFNSLCRRFSVSVVVWNRCYEPWRIQRDKVIKTYLESLSIEVNSFNASLLWEPWQIAKADGTSYKVFTPFYRKGCLQAAPPRNILPVPTALDLLHDAQSLSLRQLALTPSIPC